MAEIVGPVLETAHYAAAFELLETRGELVDCPGEGALAAIELDSPSKARHPSDQFGGMP